ncbi:MAG: UDP-N-acetylmuramoyl-L-alanyl-D-glutamate--2,6-diaminopimelate ligase [Bacteroidales bacterium]|nr:UDP-N-acetylmuramoyl-L-alanyl-D-glutamate--2,6-diaminopimelate ligase [Bacteroidales bacterium]
MRNCDLHSIVKEIAVLQVVGDTHKNILAIDTDSRKIKENMVFVAVRGVAIDGHAYIESAEKQGAVAVVCEQLPETTNPAITYIVVENSVIACGYMLRAFYGINFDKMKVVGVTGTNGKTTTATLLYRLFTQLGNKCGLLSTVVNYVGTEEFASTHTTPDMVQLYELFEKMQNAGCIYCFMEVSSHAIHQNRTAGVSFSGGIFTNITQDHLDYHKTFAEYVRVKKSFFDQLPSSAFALTNDDDRNGQIMLQNTKARKSSYSLKSMSEFKCRVLEQQFDGMLLKIDNVEVVARFIGYFNAYNLLAVYSAAMLLGQDKQQTLQIISTLTPVAGRIEFFKSKNNVTAVVDYAHTPDALENILTTLKALCPQTNKIITVVGAGGNRDKTKRPIMGKICAKLSDQVILTSDNPRNEDAADIANQMLEGVDQEYKANVLTILDRKQAIRTSVMLAQKGDVILIAGKGHETYQEIQGVKHHFDDREIVKEIFNQ